MQAKRRLLAAVTAIGYVHARRALHERFELVPAFSLSQATASLRHSGIDAVLCSIHFDDSRMFDLLHEAKGIAPQTPFVCCRILHSDLTAQVLSGMAHAAQLQGALAFIDYNELHRQHGFAEADRMFLERLLSVLPPESDISRPAAGSS
jgi:hypothetical protein